MDPSLPLIIPPLWLYNSDNIGVLRGVVFRNIKLYKYIPSKITLILKYIFMFIFGENPAGIMNN